MLMETWLLLVLAGIVLMLRLLCRKISKVEYWWDDWFAAVSFVSTSSNRYSSGPSFDIEIQLLCVAQTTTNTEGAHKVLYLTDKPNPSLPQLSASSDSAKRPRL